MNSSNTFSKTKFKSEETNDININSPNFWEQAQKVETNLKKFISDYKLKKFQ